MKGSAYIPYDFTPQEKVVTDPVTTSNGLLTGKVRKDQILIFTPDRNTGDKKDYTGAFLPEAEKFAKTHGLGVPSLFTVKLEPHRRRHNMAQAILGGIHKHKPKVVVMFCHGYATGLQLGFNSPKRKGVTKTDKGYFQLLGDAIAEYSANPTVILYACSTGDDPDGDPDTVPGAGDDSFADLLRDHLCRAGATGCRIVSHTTAGHTTMNPYVKFYDGRGSPLGGVGTGFLVEPKTPHFKTFVRMLQKDPQFRFRFPFMTVGRIHELIEETANQ